MAEPVLSIEDLCIDLRRSSGDVRLVDRVSLQIGAGEAVGLVGESGSGKSMTAFGIINLFPSPAIHVSAGSIRFQGQDLRALTAEAWQAVRGAQIAMVFQDPSSFLDPLMPVGRQIAETLIVHGRTERTEARVRELLDLMELPDGASVARKYPHELSGGMRQRILIAAALAMDPVLLIADEPTTALDVTVQAGILDLLHRLQQQLGLSLLLITHDLGIVAETCHRAYVMYAGRMVETNDVAGLFRTPHHPYSQGLLRSMLPASGPRVDLFSIPGRVPSAAAMPCGCRFHPRCPLAHQDPCVTREPVLTERSFGGADACWRAEVALTNRTWSQDRAREWIS